MAWQLVAPNQWKNDRSDFTIKFDEAYGNYIVESVDGRFSIPFDDIFNNPVFPIDLSQVTVLGKHFRAEGVNTPGTPGFSFQGDANSGMYRISEDRIGFSVGGVRQGEFSSGYGGFTGNIIQNINSENDYSHIITNTTNWNQDLLSGIATPWEISITPRYSNSKIIINALINGYISATGSTYFGISIWRKIGAGSYTQIYIPLTDTNSSYEIGFAGATSSALYGNFSRLFIDSPNTINQVTYKFTIRPYNNTTFTHSINIPPNKSKSFCLLQEIQQ